jgi:predicted lipid carrier protein YhbT
MILEVCFLTTHDKTIPSFKNEIWSTRFGCQAMRMSLTRTSLELKKQRLGSKPVKDISYSRLCFFFSYSRRMLKVSSGICGTHHFSQNGYDGLMGVDKSRIAHKYAKTCTQP